MIPRSVGARQIYRHVRHAGGALSRIPRQLGPPRRLPAARGKRMPPRFSPTGTCRFTCCQPPGPVDAQLRTHLSALVPLRRHLRPPHLPHPPASRASHAFHAFHAFHFSDHLPVGTPRWSEKWEVVVAKAGDGGPNPSSELVCSEYSPLRRLISRRRRFRCSVAPRD